MLDDSNEASGATVGTSMVNKTELEHSSEEQPPQPYEIPAWLKRRLRKTYGRRPMALVDRYFRSMVDHAAYASNVAFVVRCRAMRIVPREYRVGSHDVENPGHVVGNIDERSYRLMLADLYRNRDCMVQISRLIKRLRERMEEMMAPEDLSCLLVMAKTYYKNTLEAARDKQRGIFEELFKEYGVGHKKKDHK